MKTRILLSLIFFLPLFSKAQWNIVGTTLETNYSEVVLNKQNNATSTLWFTPNNTGPASQGHYYIRAFDWWGPYLHFKASGDNGNETMTVTIDGKLGVGTSDPSSTLHVINNTALGSTQGNYQRLSTLQGKSGNKFMNNVWLYRDASGSDWLTARLHDGISIDNSFLSPGVDTRTWWERDPYNNIQSWGTGNTTYLTLKAGKLGIGESDPKYPLTVDGTISAKEVKVSNTPNSDYVFEPDYNLLSLSEVEEHIKEKRHLPGIPSAEEFKQNGVGLGEMDDMLLRKVEELTLYTLQQQKELEKLKNENEDLKAKNKILEEGNEEFKKIIYNEIENLKSKLK